MEVPVCECGSSTLTVTLAVLPPPVRWSEDGPVPDVDGEPQSVPVSAECAGCGKPQA